MPGRRALLECHVLLKAQAPSRWEAAAHPLMLAKDLQAPVRLWAVATAKAQLPLAAHPEFQLLGLVVGQVGWVSVELEAQQLHGWPVRDLEARLGQLLPMEEVKKLVPQPVVPSAELEEPLVEAKLVEELADMARSLSEDSHVCTLHGLWHIPTLRPSLVEAHHRGIAQVLP